MKVSRYISIGVVLSMMSMMASCGSNETGTESTASAESTVQEESNIDSSAESSMESQVEEEASRRLLKNDDVDGDGIYAEASTGIGPKIAVVYDSETVVVKNGWLRWICGMQQNAETDFSGYAFLSGLSVDQEYTFTVKNSEEEQVGTVLVQMSENEVEGTETEGKIVFSVSNGNTSMIDLAITATDDDGTVSSFELSRVDAWDMYEVTPAEPEQSASAADSTAP